jgi:dephospho-CoA kinase
MLFLTGPHGAGKTTVAKILTGYNFSYIDLGGTLRERHKKEDCGIDFESWCKKNENDKGKFFTDDLIVEEIKKMIADISSGPDTPKDIAIVGSRSFNGIQYITQRINSFKGLKNTIIYIDTPPNILIERYCKREGKRLSAPEFGLLLEKDKRLGLPSIEIKADVKITNNGSMEDLRKKIEKIISQDLNCLR